MRNILLGLTGSVATVLWQKLIDNCRTAGFEPTVILTERAKQFVNVREIQDYHVTVYTDSDEWPQKQYKKDDNILHIILREAFDALVIAPITANTIAKLHCGICDNLLTSVFLAWPLYKPILMAPAMNTVMWKKDVTSNNLNALKNIYNNLCITLPQTKMLACGQSGQGAMADISTIISNLKDQLSWNFPLSNYYYLPTGDHVGAFKSIRHGYYHTGVDLYCKEGEYVYPVEDGEVVSIGPFTGSKVNSGWWEDTDYVMVKGASGVVCYGEISVRPSLQVGDSLRKGAFNIRSTSALGHVKRVIKIGNEHYNVKGWSPAMLHLELYDSNITIPTEEYNITLHDPTQYLLDANYRGVICHSNPFTEEDVHE